MLTDKQVTAIVNKIEGMKGVSNINPVIVALQDIINTIQEEASKNVVEENVPSPIKYTKKSYKDKD